MEFCSIFSGSSGNCLYVASDRTKILVDAGLSGKKIQEGLKEIGINPCDIDAIVITHEHDDHIKSAGILSRRFNIPIYANTNTWEAMIDKLGEVKRENIKIFDDYNSFEIGDVFVIPYEIPHDAVKPCGYSFTDGNVKISIATDIGYASDNVKENIKDSDLILLESNHDVEMLKVGPYPYPLKLRILGDKGHLSNEAAGNTIVDILNSKIKKIILGHLSKTNNYPQLALRTVLSILEMNNIRDGRDVDIDIALRDKVGRLQIIK
ncbi:Phosphoribosyl 1,2-cyclic phosphodiesterase [Caloramator quimbayensis]|uniref:Phosphoribosyl 1,2-cyclic phosphodiesterase n=1 Tax=Caloramator quimbayensis TaxID=1147123 RepID=A0A1T4Y657_9CLOT|nr:MBL fold metallo-hydrolase [Caloramator quimbayensis]SKA96998.1 Phosphoribosyl 1,2-cyclic phosphodiesterase [Caloramator quimbayensis]